MSKNKVEKNDHANINTGNIGRDKAGGNINNYSTGRDKAEGDINNYSAGRDISQVGRDNTNTTTTTVNIRLWISLILISIIALGAGAYFLRVRFSPTEGEINIDSPSNQQQSPPIFKQQKGDK